MPVFESLNLNLPTIREIRAKAEMERDAAAYKALRPSQKELPYANSGESAPFTIFPTMQDWQHAITASLPGSERAPSSDPHLSSLVAAGITWLANTLPEPDLLVKKKRLRKRGGKKMEDDIIERHPFYDLLEEPNPEDTGSDLWKAFAYSWIISGNVYFIKFRNAFGQVVRLEYEPHFNVRARWRDDKQGEYLSAGLSQSVAGVPRTDDPTVKINYFEVDRSGVKYRLEPADVIHFKDGKDPHNTRYGISRIQTIFREIYQDSAVASYAAELLGGSGVIPCVIGVEDKEGLFSLEDLANIKASVVAQITGSNARMPVVLNSRHTFTRTALTPQELDLRTTRSMAQDVFSAVTGIPAIVLNFSSGMERSIYNNMSEADRRAVTSYLQPIWWHRDQVLTRQLLRDIDQNEQLFIESDLSEVGALQEDENEKVTRIVSMYQGQVIKRSEARTELGYEIEDGDEVYLVKAGTETVTLEQEEEMREEPEPVPPNGQFPVGEQPRILSDGSVEIN